MKGMGWDGKEGLWRAPGKGSRGLILAWHPQAGVVRGTGPALVRPPGSIQHASGNWGLGVPCGPFQRLVHEL
jgi:hypothetical protein